MTIVLERRASDGEWIGVWSTSFELAIAAAILIGLALVVAWRAYARRQKPGDGVDKVMEF